MHGLIGIDSLFASCEFVTHVTYVKMSRDISAYVRSLGLIEDCWSRWKNIQMPGFVGSPHLYGMKT